MSSTLSQVQALAAAGDVVLSQHAYDRLAENGIAARDIEVGIALAATVEDYPDFHKGPSVLVLQRDLKNQPIHVVWGIRKNTTGPAIVITAYRPDPERWSTDFRSRR